MTTFSDDFNRSDRNLSGDNGWAVEPAWTPKICSAHVAVILTPGFASDCYAYQPDSPSADYYSEIRTNYINGGDGGPVVRYNAGTGNGYVMLVSGGNIFIYKITGGTRSSLGAESFSWSGPGLYRLEVIGSTLNGYVDGVLVITRTDSTHAGPGAPAFFMHASAFACSDVAPAKYTDFLTNGVTQVADPSGKVGFRRPVSGPREPPVYSLSGRVLRLPRLFHIDGPGDEAGSPISCRGLRKSVPIPPHPSHLLGGVIRIPRMFHFTPPDEPGSPISCRGLRKSRPIPPHPSRLLGSFRRKKSRPASTVGVEFYQIYEQGYRVADSSKALYELFVGVDESPDLGGSPTATSATLPFSWTPPPGPVTLHVVVRRRNQYDLQSFNVYETLIVVSAEGAEDPGLVSAPFDVKVYEGSPLYARVIAKYVESSDRHPADTWEVYAKVGSDPDPDVDPLVYSSDMGWIGKESGLSTEIGPYVSGDVLHVVVGVRRGSGGASAFAGAVTLLIQSYDITDGQVFGGQSYEDQ